MTGHWYEKSKTSALFSLLTLALLFKFASNEVYKKIRTGKGENYNTYLRKTVSTLRKGFNPYNFPSQRLARFASDKQTGNNIFTFLINNTADLVIESQVHHQNPHPKSP